MDFKNLIQNTKRKREYLIEEIKEAFHGVKLENGIGLKEGDGIYGYNMEWYPKEELLKLRKKDEKENWVNVPFEDICHNHVSAFYYLDEKGMRFYFPKLMIAHVLENELSEKGIHLDYDPETFLENIDDGQFDLFNKKQIKAVISYLEYRLEYRLLSEIQTNIDCGISKEHNQSLYENKKSELLEKLKLFIKNK